MMNQWLLFQALLFPVVLADLGVELCTRKDVTCDLSQPFVVSQPWWGSADMGEHC